jgi:pyridinium-3,5-biscarboxylic acid mononucleotide synthase
MNRDQLQILTKQLLAGQLPLEEFLAQATSPGAANPSVANLGVAQVDLDRHNRCGFPEVVFAEGKSVAAIERIFDALLQHGADVLATRMTAEQAAELMAKFPTGCYNAVGRTFRLSGKHHREKNSGRVAIVTAGTSDLPVAEEARETALWTGASVTLLQDVGVAGPHRLVESLPLLKDADAIVVVAGMEGALPSVVGGHVACPVIAVPTSIGYGASFGGVAALLGMLNSCASNVTVVNIDAGFKGGYVAGLIAKNMATAREQDKNP